MDRICVLFPRLESHHRWGRPRKRLELYHFVLSFPFEIDNPPLVSYKEKFFIFAAEYWADHVVVAGALLDGPTQEVIEQFYDPSNRMPFGWELATRRLSNEFGMMGRAEDVSAIQIAANEGQSLNLRRLPCASQTVPDREITRETSALICATPSGHLSTAKTLHGADINHERRNGMGTLTEAMRQEHLEMIELLTDKDDKTTERVLVYAVEGHTIQQSSTGSWVKSLRLLIASSFSQLKMTTKQWSSWCSTVEQAWMRPPAAAEQYFIASKFGQRAVVELFMDARASRRKSRRTS